MPSGRQWGVAMRGLIRRAAVAFGAAAVLLGPAAGAAAGTSAPVPGWSITPSPNPVIPTGQLFGVSCPAANSCMAVGTYVKASGAGVTLAERWDGTSWRILPTPNPARATVSALNGVACSTPSACTAVGQAIIGGVSQALAERWNGRSWRIQRTPNPGGSPSRLSAVACPAADTCTAVGSANSKLLVEQWGGSRWRVQFAPVPPGTQAAELNAVTCTGANSCVAVGDYVTGSGADVT